MKKIFIIVFTLLSITTWAQDIHFTNFQLAPMSLNPALTGGFQGTLRASGIFRDQNAGGYNTLAGGFEYNIPFGFRKQDWIAVGLEYIQDKEKIVDGINVRKISMTNISVAYHFPLDKKYKNTLSAAIQYKLLSHNINLQNLNTPFYLTSGSYSTFFDEIKNSGQDGEGKSISLKDWEGAFALRSKIGKKNSFSAGLSFAHILKLDQAASGTGGSTTTPVDNVPLRMTFFSQAEFFVNDKISIQPAVLFQHQKPFSEFAVQSLVGLVFNEKKNIKINPGLGYRFGDALEFLFIMDFGKFKFGAAFDLTTSGYKSSEGKQNAFELGLTYTTTIIKKPKVKPVIFCPRL